MAQSTSPPDGSVPVTRRDVLRIGASFAGVPLLARTQPLLAVDGQPAPVKSREDDLQSLQGTWRIESRTKDGKVTPKDSVHGELIITGDRFIVTGTGRADKKGTLKIDPTQAPKAIDVIYDDPQIRGRVARGIYVLEGDTLRICGADLDEDRPTTFESKERDRKVVEVFRRVKP